jgi:transcription antitermination factor NusG
MQLAVDIFEPRTPPSGELWLCATTQPGRELFAAANLEVDNFEVYLPLTQNASKRLIPLFGTYLFVKQCNNYPKLRKIDGITGIIARNDEPVPIKSEIIAELRNRERNGIIPTVQITPRIRQFASGEPIRLTQGAQSGLLGTFERMLSRNRASVNISLFGNITRLNVPIGQVVAQASHKAPYIN